MPRAWELTTPPAAEPVTLAEAKAHLRVDDASGDSDITLKLAAARHGLENDLGRAFITQTWKMYLSEFPAGGIELPRAPLSSVTSVKYRDAADVEQTLASASYEVEPGELPPLLRLRDGYSWPATAVRTRAVTIEFVAGYGASGSAVPAPIRQAILLRLGDLYTLREETGPSKTALGAVDRLVASYKVWMNP